MMHIDKTGNPGMFLGKPAPGVRVVVIHDYWWPFLSPQIVPGLNVKQGRKGRIESVSEDERHVWVRWEDDSYRQASMLKVPTRALMETRH